MIFADGRVVCYKHAVVKGFRHLQMRRCTNVHMDETNGSIGAPSQTKANYLTRKVKLTVDFLLNEGSHLIFPTFYPRDSFEARLSKAPGARLGGLRVGEQVLASCRAEADRSPSPKSSEGPTPTAAAAAAAAAAAWEEDDAMPSGAPAK